MVKPSPQLSARLRFTTKQVGRGFYRGNRTGSVGAHTEYGGYLVDWRKTKRFNMPDIQDFNLTPFVTREMQPSHRAEEAPDGTLYTPRKIDALEFLRDWKRSNPQEYEYLLDYQQQNPSSEAAAESEETRPAPQDDEPQVAQKYAETQLAPSYTETQRAMNYTGTQPAPKSEKEAKAERKEKKALREARKMEIKRLLKQEKPRRHREGQPDSPSIPGRAGMQNYSTFTPLTSEQKKEFEKLLTEEGRRRKRAGLPRTPTEQKRRFREIAFYSLPQAAHNRPREPARQVI